MLVLALPFRHPLGKITMYRRVFHIYDKFCNTVNSRYIAADGAVEWKICQVFELSFGGERVALIKNDSSDNKSSLFILWMLLFALWNEIVLFTLFPIPIYHTKATVSWQKSKLRRTMYPIVSQQLVHKAELVLAMVGLSCGLYDSKRSRQNYHCIENGAVPSLLITKACCFSCAHYTS